MLTERKLQSQRLNQLMHQNGIKNSRQFSIVLKINYSQFNKIMNGDLALPQKHAKTISKQYGVPEDWISGKDDAPEPITAKQAISNIISQDGKIEPDADIAAIIDNAGLSAKEKIHVLAMQLALERLTNAELRIKLQLKDKLEKAEKKKKPKN